jgi:hypothetical protein
VLVTNGVYNVTLGSVTPITLPFDAPYFLGITVGAETEMTPRLALASVGYAFRAKEVDTVAAAAIPNNSITASKLAPSGCTGGQVLQYNGSTWVCATVGGGGGGGTVTAVGTGTGLTGGPITTSGVIGLAATQMLPPGGCSTGQITKWSGSNWVCAADGPTTAFVYGGNAFGGNASLGTLDNHGLFLTVNSAVALSIIPTSTSPNLVGGHNSNYLGGGVGGAVIAGGGAAGAQEPVLNSNCNTSCANRVTGHGGTVSGGASNQAGSGAYATVAGGFANTAGGYSIVGGGLYNHASGPYSTVSGGWGSYASDYGVVAGGYYNLAGSAGAVAGGSYNEAGAYGFVGSGYANKATGGGSSVLGGYYNHATDNSATVAGGHSNRASGPYSFAAGRSAKTETAAAVAHAGAFVWADSNNHDFRSTADNEMSARATGGVRFVTAIDGSGNPTAQVTIDNTATVTASGLKVASNGTKITRMQAGEANLGAGVAGVNTYTIAFLNAFTGTPRVVVTPKTDLFTGFEVDDTMVASIRAISPTQFKVNVYRVDSPGGSWSVNLRLEWMAWE